MNIQELIKKKVGQVYVILTTEEDTFDLLNKLTKLNFFTNLKGWVTRNAWSNKSGSMKYLVLNLETKEVAFNRRDPSDELMETKLFVNQYANFTMNGPKLKLEF